MNKFASRSVALAAAVTLVLAACSSADEPETETTSAAPAASATALEPTVAPPTTAPTAEDVVAMDARTLIDTLDASPLEARATDLMASIRPDEILVTTADGTETSVPMPAEEFYVSIAPYVDQTHECYFHSLTTCTGELGDASIHVTVTDAAGEVVLDEDRTTFANGFVGLWLPRDLDGEVTITYDGKSATAPLSTVNADDATCVTTMQLA